MNLRPENREGRAVAAVLEAAGWTVATESGGQRAMCWPDGESVVVVPLDPALNGYDTQLDSVIEQLAFAVRRGDNARTVLGRLTAEGVIS